MQRSNNFKYLTITDLLAPIVNSRTILWRQKSEKYLLHSLQGLSTERKIIKFLTSFFS